MPEALLPVRVTPRSSREKIEVADGVVRVWVMASPTDGQANEAVCKVVAKAVGLPPSRVTVARGHTAREKTLALEGMTLEDALQRLNS